MNREAQLAELRPLLFSLAYRILGTRADAEDMVQEAYLRWAQAAQSEVRSPRAYLSTIVARLSLDSLKAARRKREVYVGPWLPEPLVEPLGTRSCEMAFAADGNAALRCHSLLRRRGQSKGRIESNLRCRPCQPVPSRYREAGFNSWTPR